MDLKGEGKGDIYAPGGHTSQAAITFSMFT